MKKFRISIKKIISLFIFLLVCLSVLFICLSNKDENSLGDIQKELNNELSVNKGNYDENKIVLKGTNETTAKDLARRLNAKLRITSDGSFATLTLPDSITINDVVNDPNNIDIIDKLGIDYKASISEVEEIVEEVEHTSRPNYSVNDPYYDKQTYLDYLNLSNIWSYTKGDGITVAIIDTGIDTDHPEFVGRISEYSYNATEDKIVKDYFTEDGSYDWSLIEDEQGHGTAVAGVIGATMNNNEGITGIAPNVTIINIKVECDEHGNFKNTSDLVFGLYYAIERDVDIVNMSFKVEGDNLFAEATKLAVDSDIICVAAAGNDSTAALTYPAADQNVIGVGALADNSFELADYSNYGENVNIVAPGTVYTTSNDGRYKTISGTSFSCSIVASIIALQCSRDRYNFYEFNDKCNIMYASCYDLGEKGEDFYFGYGLIDTRSFIIEERKVISYNYLIEDIENNSQIFIKNHPLQTIFIPESTFGVFDGWYYDIHCLEECNLYEDSWPDDITLYCKWVNEDSGLPYLYRELEDETIEITGYTGKSRYITIPDSIDGKLVSSIGENAFKNQVNLKKIVLPRNLKIIKANAFENCIKITEFSIPDSVTSIKQYAFKNNIRLSSINLSSNSNLINIGSGVFENCSSLYRFDIPKNVNKIDVLTFYGCDNLKYINADKNSNYFSSIDGVLLNKSKTILLLYPSGKSSYDYDVPDSVLTLSKLSFFNTKIKTINLNNISIIEEYVFYGSNIEYINISNNVTYLGDSSFENSRLKNIDLGKGIKYISPNTFKGTSYLKKIYIPSNIISIGYGSFLDSSLGIIEFEENSNLITIGSYAFCGCTGLINIEIPNSVTSIGSNAFVNTKLSMLNLPNSVTSIGSEAFRSSTLNEINIDINSNLTLIGERAFSNTLITDIYIPNSVKIISDFCFENTLLMEVYIPKTVESLSSSAFASCNLLENIRINDNNQNYKDIDGVVYSKNLNDLIIYPSGKSNSKFEIKNNIYNIKPYAFYGSIYLKEIYIPNSMTIINNFCFAGASSVEKIVIPDTIENIGSYAFYDCISLNSISIGKNVSKIGSYAFRNCSSLEYVSFANDIKLNMFEEGTFKNCYKLKNIYIPNRVTRIENEAFYNCKSLTNILITKNIVFIGDNAFYGDINLNTIDFASNSKLDSIGTNAFSYCKITTISLPANLTNLSNTAFQYCDNLNTINFCEGSKLEIITAYSFKGCNNLKTINFEFGSNLKNIQAHSFEGLTSLEKINLSNTNVTNIDNYAFRYCCSLSEINLPATVEYIGRFAFFGCENLSNIHLPANITFVGRFAFNLTNNINIYFESTSLPIYLQEDWDYGISGYYIGVNKIYQKYDFELVELYNDTVSISKYFGKSEELDLNLYDFGCISQIGGYAFYRSNVKKIVLPSTVQLIDKYSFANSSLEEIYIPNTVQLINDYAFFNSNLKEVKIDKDSKLEKIGKYAFSQCEYLTDYYFTSKITEIGSYAFSQSGLQHVQFSKDIYLSEIQKGVFLKTKLIKIDLPNSLKIIDYNAFRDIETLKEVNFGCSSNILHIMNYAFYNTGLEKLYIPSNVEYIGDYSLVGLRNLKEYIVEESNEYYTSINGVLYSKDLKTLIAFPGNKDGSFKVEKTVEIIGNGAFENSKLQNISFDDDINLLKIGYRSFYNLYNLEEISIPRTVISLNSYSFAMSSSLKTVNFTQDSNLTYLSEGMFYGCVNLTNVILPNSLNSIGKYAFTNSPYDKFYVAV